MNFYLVIAMAIAFYLACTLLGIGALAILRSAKRNGLQPMPIRTRRTSSNR